MQDARTALPYALVASMKELENACVNDTFGHLLRASLLLLSCDTFKVTASFALPSDLSDTPASYTC